MVSACQGQPEFPGAIVYIVDDDPALRSAMGELLRSADISSELFGAPREFLAHRHSGGPACLILDVQLPEVSGLDLQSTLAGGDMPMPIIFVTGHGTIPMSVRAMKMGAAEFLTKPFEGDALIHAVRAALAQDQARRAVRAELGKLRDRYARLTPRERQVLALVVQGRLNKQIAAELGMAEQTVKVHRGRVMAKLEVRSVAELVKAISCLPAFPKAADGAIAGLDHVTSYGSSLATVSSLL